MGSNKTLVKTFRAVAKRLPQLLPVVVVVVVLQGTTQEMNQIQLAFKTEEGERESL